MPELSDFVNTGRLEVKVKTNAPKTRVISFDPLCIAVAAPPEQNKANITLIKYLEKTLKQPVRIVTGATSKRKVFRVG